MRTRAAVLAAAKSLFLEKGYAGTTMEEIAARAGLTKRTVYNNYADKGALFTEIVSDVIAEVEAFTRGLREGFGLAVGGTELPAALHDLGRRLALAILRSEVVALRRLLIGEGREFPELARDYYARAPGRVLTELTACFERLAAAGVLRVHDARRAAEQFGYLVAGAPLDRAVLTGQLPSADEVLAAARDGVETFLARYAAGGG